MVRIATDKIQEFERQHIARLRALAPECMVLLKKNGDFPLCASGKIALYGSGARKTVKGGTGSGDVNVRHFVTVEEGLENAGCIVTTKEWLDAYDRARESAQKNFYDDIRAQAKVQGRPAFLVGLGKVPEEPVYDLPLNGEGEVCLYVLSRNSGEGADRSVKEGDLLLAAHERRDILACAEKYEKFMLVLNVGGVVDLSPVQDKVENILLLGQLGTVTGDAFADVLFGRAYPSGRLTTTWAAAEGYSSIGDFGRQDDTCYREGIYVGYRYFDTAGKEPLFPFGFGLGYTDFSVKTEGFAVTDGIASVSVTVRNEGSFAGREVVSLYYSAPEGRLKKPLRELGAYGKTGELKPGEQETIILTLPMENMASWDTDNASWILEKGDYVIYIGEQAVGIVVLEGDAVTARLTDAGGDCGFADWQPVDGVCDSENRRSAGKWEVGQDLPRIIVKAEELEKIGHFDRGRIKAESFAAPDLSTYTDEELASVCAGKFKEDQGIAGIIGNASFAVAGAAGETSDVVRDKGFGKMVLADGPAGLRIATRYLQRDEGAEGLDTGSMEQMICLFDEPVQELIRSKRAQTKEAAEHMPVYYQYASAIPIGTALAQAWNPEVPRICGDIVGEEMERFGINVWLAPAMNIHRSPLCGRNFEYYSEDPVLSGKTAAAVTLGVQSHKNCIVTVKHFSCNNQETNRFGSNSMVSRRALREIYLKGFEICVKEEAPKALMTSYNLLNGVHTANRRDLLTEVLRKEWGFSGFVMTDWGTTSSGFNMGKHGSSSPALCIKAGNDLIMPGSRKDVEGILEGLGTEVTREELEQCAGRILAMSGGLSE